MLHLNDIDFEVLGRKVKKCRSIKNKIAAIGKFIDDFNIPVAIIDILIDLGFISKRSRAKFLWSDSGFIYAPYVPLMTTSSISLPKATIGSTGVLSRYCKLHISGDLGKAKREYRVVI